MFDRYTEKARRTIFFARYEASNFGSRFIETEHLLLGILREERGLAKWFPGQKNAETEIRAEIKERLVQGDPIAVSVEVPLSLECKQVLNLAGDSAEKLGHRRVEPEHLLIAILRIEKSTAAQILLARGIKPEPIEELAAKGLPARDPSTGIASPLFALEAFLSGLKSLNKNELINFFGAKSEMIDVWGGHWNYEEICARFEALFGPYAKKNATYMIERKLIETAEFALVSVLWKNAILASEQRVWMHRMSFVLECAQRDWEIQFVQVTPVRPPESISS